MHTASFAFAETLPTALKRYALCAGFALIFPSCRVLDRENGRPAKVSRERKQNATVRGPHYIESTRIAYYAPVAALN